MVACSAQVLRIAKRRASLVAPWQHRNMSAIQQAEPRARRRSIILSIVLVMLGTFAIALVEARQEQITNWIGANARTMLRDPLTVAAGVFVMCSPLLALALYLFSLGRRVVNAARFPPPRHAVVRDTTIFEGCAAIRRGRSLQLLSFVFAAMAGVAVFFVLNILGEIAKTS